MLKRCVFILCLILAGTWCLPEGWAYRPESPGSRRSCQPYSIKGKQYQPLADHTGFVQGGTASWYGSDFQGRETSSGERYNMHAMTAAHKTLPLGVYVKVHNRRNGKQVVVRVNDRGPFIDGRIIDLSYSAAKSLGVVKSGTADVTVEALGFLGKNRKGRTVYRSPANYDTGLFAIQVGSCSSMENAQLIADDMRSQYIFTTIREATVHGERYYRVHAGTYTSLKDAERVRRYSSNKLLNSGYVVAVD